MGPKTKGAVKCAGCNFKIDSKEPTVEALSKKWHKACFACVNCAKPIDGDFHPVDNKPWCNDCFMEKKAPRCADCGLPISGTSMKTEDGKTFHKSCFDKLSLGICEACKTDIAYTDPVIEALGNKYHDRCFRCTHCGNAVPENFHAENGQPFCDDCHQKNRVKTSPVCDVCESAITKGTRIEAIGKSYHEACFADAAWGPCDNCHAKVLLTEPSVKVSALNRFWHLGCLNCADCNESIRIKPFYLQQDRPCCEACYVGHIAPKCAGCAKPIADDRLNAMKQSWHPECFVCSVCHNILASFGTEFFNVQGRPYCKRDIEAANITVLN
ncbi:putative Leupaxin [Hypsibius exemplaris]|uniref:Leupaxin n=1 Tax=Hypsibius exemplaris TaxID=2072580 RepID=A0A1W0X0L2_HYPEX|nr:putative Leupaxin [Hypsibius exemplaris]